jgi:transposase
VHAVLAKQGVAVPVSDLFGTSGQALLDQLRLDLPYAARVGSLRRLVEAFDFEIDVVGRRVAAQLAGHPGYTAVQAIDGVGPVLAAVFVAEIGDVHRFARAEQLCSWAGLTPRHRESDTTVHRGPITKQGSPLVRWAAVEAVQRVRGGPIGRTRARIGERRGANIGKVAAAPQTAHAGLLRAARRAHPRPGPTRVNPSPAQPGREVVTGLTPHTCGVVDAI